MKNFYRHEGVIEARRSRRKGEARLPRRGKRKRVIPYSVQRRNGVVDLMQEIS